MADTKPYVRSPTNDAEFLTQFVKRFLADAEPIIHLRARRIAKAVAHMAPRDAATLIAAVTLNAVSSPFLFPDEE